jgi:hypothetical protein
MQENQILNKIAELTGKNTDDYKNLLGPGFIRRVGALFTNDIVHDEYNISLYYCVVAKYFEQKGDNEKALKYKNLLVENVIDDEIYKM